jgi:ABC-type phosphate/phosphonate transport system substrate-binding protein
MRQALRTLAAAVALCSVAAPAAGPAKRQTRLHCMGSHLLFTTVNRNDAIASMRAWILAVGRSRGFDFELKLEVFDSTDEAEARLRENSVDALTLDTPDYLKLAALGLIEPVAIGTNRGRPGAYSYMLLVRDDTGIRGLADLRGREVVINSRTKSGVGLAWLETHLAANRLGRAAEFFGAVQETYRPSTCALPLFFGRVDACVIDEGNFEVMKELNPQLGRLKELGRSEPLVEGLVAMPVKPHPHREELIEAILGLHKVPAGAQMVTLFKTGAMIRAGPEHFESSRALWSRYNRLGRAGQPSGEGAAR